MPVDLERIAHDLRQPLQSISLLNSALGRVSKDPKALEIVTMQKESIDRMRDLIDELDSAAPRP